MMTRRTVLSNKPATKLGGTGAIRPNPCKRYLVPRASVALEEQSSRGIVPSGPQSVIKYRAV